MMGDSTKKEKTSSPKSVAWTTGMVRLIEESLPAPHIMCSPYHTPVIHFKGLHIKGYHSDPHLATSYPFQCPFFRASPLLLSSDLHTLLNEERGIRATSCSYRRSIGGNQRRWRSIPYSPKGVVDDPYIIIKRIKIFQDQARDSWLARKPSEQRSAAPFLLSKAHPFSCSCALRTIPLYTLRKSLFIAPLLPYGYGISPFL